MSQSHQVDLYTQEVDPNGAPVGPATEVTLDSILDAIGASTDSPASQLIYETATTRTLIALQKAIKNILLDIGTTLLSTSKVDPAASTLTIYNVTCTLANTEYSQALPANCRGFEFACRQGAVVRWSNVTGKVAAPTDPYMTLQAGDHYSSPPVAQGASPSTLYFASATAGSVVCIIAWS